MKMISRALPIRHCEEHSDEAIHSGLPRSRCSLAVTKQAGGSAVMLVLIAVVLFAALTFAVMHSSRSGSGMTQEKARIAASEVLSYAKNVEQAITRMTTVYGVGEQSIDPGHSETTYAGVTDTNFVGNSNCTQTNCRIFTDKGGTVVVNRFTQYVGTRPSWWLETWPQMPKLDLVMVDVNGVGTPLPDVALRISGLSDDVCKAIHTQLNLPLVDALEWGTGTDRIYSPSDMNSATPRRIGYSNTAFKNATSFCIGIAGSNPNYTEFHHIVLAR